MCNHAAGLSRWLTKVQDSMFSQLKSLRGDSKSTGLEPAQQAVEEIEYLVTFNRSISQAMQRTMQDLSGGFYQHGKPHSGTLGQLPRVYSWWSKA